MADEADDLFRWCIYCGADCYEDEPEHDAACPMLTGLYPVREEELGRCSSCGHPERMTLCADCEQALDVGDFYLYRQLEDAGPDVFEKVCVGCAASAL